MAKKSKTGRNKAECRSTQAVYNQLLNTFDQAQRNYEHLMQRLISMSGFAILAYTVFMGQNPYFVHELVTGQPGVKVALATLLLLSFSWFLWNFFAGVLPRTGNPIYAPEFASCDTKEELCELYEQLVEDLRATVEKAHRRNEILGGRMKQATVGVVASLVFLTALLLLAETPILG